MLLQVKEVVLEKMLKKIILPVIALVIVFAQDKAHAFEVGAEADYWFTSLSGDIKSGTSGTTLDFKDNLNMDGYNSAGINVHIELGDHLLSIGYTPLSYSGTTTLSSLINVQGSQFNADIKSGLRLNMTDVQYTYWLVNSSMGAFAKVALSGIGVGYSGNSFIDAMAAIEVSPLPFVGISLGYRTVTFKLDTDDAELNANVSGLFVGFFANF